MSALERPCRPPVEAPVPAVAGGWTLLLPLLLLLGCGGATADEQGVVRVDTVAGVVHVVSGERGVWAASRPWRVDRERALEIGALEGPEPYVFGDISAVYVDGEGRIHVADTQALEVRVFSSDGEFLARYGRGGEGPGEFRNLSGLGGGPNDGTAALDGSLGRVSLFGSDGTFSRSFRLERPFMILYRGAPVPFDAEGSFHDVTRLAHGIGMDSLAVVRYSPAGEVEDTLLIAVHAPPSVLVRRNGVPVMSFRVPFTPAPSVAVGPDGRIYATMGGEYRIAVLGPKGDTLRVIRREVAPSPVTAAERDSALAWIRERHREAAGTEIRELPDIPSHRPAIGTLRLDERGYLWAFRGGGASPRADALEWDVFDPDGRYLGTLALPAMNVTHVGERTVAGIVRDELDVPRALVLPLERR